MASLLGKADATLISAARSEAMANVPLDMSDVYKKREKNLEDFTKRIKDTWDLKNKDNNDSQAYVEGETDKLLTNVTTGQINTALADETVYAAKELKTELMKYDKDSLEYKKVQAKINKLVGVTDNNNQVFIDLINSDLLYEGSGDEVKLWKQMIHDYNNDDNKSDIKYKDGDFVYTLKEDTAIGSPIIGGERDPDFDIETKPKFSMTLSELKEKLGSKDTTAPTAVLTSLNTVFKNENKRPWDADHITDTENAVAGHMKTPNDRRNVMTNKFPGMKWSIHDALGGDDPDLQKELFDAFEALPGIGLDVNKDGIKDSDPGKDNGVNFDYSSADNVFKLYQALADSPEGGKIISKIITDRVGGTLHKRGENKRAVGGVNSYNEITGE